MTRLISLVILVFILVPSFAIAHTGHNHSDGLHQTIAVIVILSSIVIIYGGTRYLRKDKNKKEN